MKQMILFALLAATLKTYAIPMDHKMQHGFVLAKNDSFGSHLVATGHHSRQTEVTGRLIIADKLEAESYSTRKSLNTMGQSYFLFQAQNLNLPALLSGQTLRGHIIESQVGKYESKNIIVKDAEFIVDEVILNLENPFFVEP